jgi:hypothetical protein
MYQIIGPLNVNVGDTDTYSVPEQPAGVANIPNIQNFDIKAYPDPVTDILQLEVNNATNSNASLHIVICDNLGRTCIDQVMPADANSDITRSIAISSLAKGIYFLTVSDNNTLLQEQTIVKQ